MDRLDAMKTFIAVAEAKGFSGAARRLHVSPPTVTRLVAFLEEHLGVRLFHRTTRSVVLTDGGRRYLERARRALLEVEAADATARSSRVEPSGRFVVTGPALFGQLHLAPVWSRYLLKYPAVRGELVLADRVVNLVEEGVDVAVRIGHLADSSLVARKVGQTTAVVVASPRYLKQRPAPRHPDDLLEHDVIHFTGVAPTSEWAFVRRGRPFAVRFAPRVVTNSGSAAIAHAVSGGGVTLALAYQVEQAVRAGQLQVLLPDFARPALPISCVYPSSRLLSVNTRVFLDLVAEQRWHFDATG